MEWNNHFNLLLLSISNSVLNRHLKTLIDLLTNQTIVFLIRHLLIGRATISPFTTMLTALLVWLAVKM